MRTAARTTNETSSHWYYPDGTPCYSVERKDGKGTRPTNLRDARELGLVPSVTSILKILAKPELTNWLIEQAVLSVLTTPRKDGEKDDQFVERVLHTERVQDQEKQAAAERGSLIHDSLGKHFRGEPYPDTVKDYVMPAANKILELFPEAKEKGRWETSFAFGTYGGMVDFIGDGESVVTVLDFKCTKSVPEREPWTEHKLQLAAYSAWAFSQYQPKTIRCGNLYISTTEPGKCVFHEIKEWLYAYQYGFTPLTTLWYWLNNLEPKGR